MSTSNPNMNINFSNPPASQKKKRKSNPICVIMIIMLVGLPIVLLAMNDWNLDLFNKNEDIYNTNSPPVYDFSPISIPNWPTITNTSMYFAKIVDKDYNIVENGTIAAMVWNTSDSARFDFGLDYYDIEKNNRTLIKEFMKEVPAFSIFKNQSTYNGIPYGLYSSGESLWFSKYLEEVGDGIPTLGFDISRFTGKPVEIGNKYQDHGDLFFNNNNITFEKFGNQNYSTGLKYQLINPVANSYAQHSIGNITQSGFYSFKIIPKSPSSRFVISLQSSGSPSIESQTGIILSTYNNSIWYFYNGTWITIDTITNSEIIKINVNYDCPSQNASIEFNDRFYEIKFANSSGIANFYCLQMGFADGNLNDEILIDDFIFSYNSKQDLLKTSDFYIGGFLGLFEISCLFILPSNLDLEQFDAKLNAVLSTYYPNPYDPIEFVKNNNIITWNMSAIQIQQINIMRGIPQFNSFANYSPIQNYSFQIQWENNCLKHLEFFIEVQSQGYTFSLDLLQAPEV